MAMSFEGISSGLPTQKMIEAILQYDNAAIDRLKSRQSVNNQKKNALNAIKNAFTALSTSISSLKSENLTKRTITSSDSSAVTATVNGAQAGSYDMVVKQLATKSRLETTNTFGSPEDSVGAEGDSYTIVNKDGQKTTITLEEGKTSLADLSKAINESDSGVTSTVVQKRPGEYVLVLSSNETGVGKESANVGIYGGSGNALGVADNEDDASSAGVNATAAQNARFTLNGVEMERTSNNITDAIDGVSFTLNKADAGKTVSLNVAMDTSFITGAFQDVVNKFNSAVQAYKNAIGTNGSGVLINDTTMTSMFSQLRTAMSGVVEEGGQMLGSAASLGMSTNRDGTITLDTKKLEEALKQNPDVVGNVFDKMSKATKTLADGLTTSGGGTLTTMINSIDTSNISLNKQIDVLNAKIDRRKEVLTAQFAKLETTIGQLQAAGQSLSGLYY